MKDVIVFGGDNNIQWIHKEAKNRPGGIMTMWHKDSFNYEGHITGKGYVVVIGIAIVGVITIIN